MTDQIPGVPRSKPENNPWYLLATLYGQPTSIEDELHGRNRIAWNRYVGRLLDKEDLALLAGKGGRVAEAAMPFTPEKMLAVEKAFAERRPQDSTARPGIPELEHDCDFSNVEFNCGLWLNGFVFPVIPDFSGAYSSKGVDFGGVIFFGSILKRDRSASVGFRRATFFGPAIFEGATFSDVAEFQGATFSDRVIFEGATFSDVANFWRTTFSGPAFFQGATFSGGAYFEGATFSDLADFQSTAFEATTSFVNAEMKNETSFGAAIFRTEPPRFFGTKLHEGTEWGNARWPGPPKNAIEARKFILAYERLKLEMDRLKKHGDELDFLALEQQSRRVWLGFLKGLPIGLYGFSSDYGRSYLRPFSLLVALVILGAIPFALCPSGVCRADILPAVQEAIGISFANTLSVCGKSLARPDMVLQLPDWLKAVSTFQAMLGIVLFFLFGLGIRNRFRMK